MMLRRALAVALVLISQFGLVGVAFAQSSAPYSYVANTSSPDAFLALKAYPSANSPSDDGNVQWDKIGRASAACRWLVVVRVWPTGEQGWAFSGRGDKAYILCCAGPDSVQAEAAPIVKDVADFDCEQLWFGRNSIFKEAGYCFKTSRAIAAFGNAGCRYDDINAVLLTPDNQNFVEAIQRIERTKACPR